MTEFQKSKDSKNCFTINTTIGSNYTFSNEVVIEERLKECGLTKLETRTNSIF